MKSRFFVLLALVAAGAQADSWNTPGAGQPNPSSGGATWEQKPAGTDSPGLIDDYMRDIKWEVRRRLEVEHDFSTLFGADSGLHREGSARAFVTGTDCTANVTGLAAADDLGLDSPGPYLGTTETNGSALLSAIPSGWSQNLGVGRLCFSISGPPTQPADPTTTTDDDYKLYVNNNGVWNEAKAQHDDQSELSRQKSGAKNLLPCGGWECMTTANTLVPTAYGWSATGTATYSYATTGTSEGDGLRFRTASTAIDSGASYSFAGLKPNTTYYAVARVNATATDTCSIRTTGATTNIPGTGTSLTTTTAVYETLYGTFTTDGTPANVIFIVESNGASDTCDWDHVGVYEQNAENVPTVRQLTKYAQNTTPVTLTGAYQTVLSASITVPTNGYVLKATGNLCIGMDPVSNVAIVTVEIHNGVSALITTSGGDHTFNAAGASYATIPIQYVDVNPLPGTTYTWSMRALEAVGDSIANEDASCTSTLIMELVQQ
jgi:hypothetical protein